MRAHNCIVYGVTLARLLKLPKVTWPGPQGGQLRDGRRAGKGRKAPRAVRKANQAFGSAVVGAGRIGARIGQPVIDRGKSGGADDIPDK